LKLAEALILRSDRMRSFDQLRNRAVAMARFQEGEQPPEDAGALVVQAQAVLDELQALIERINLTNATARLEDGSTITQALAEREILRLRHALLTSVADAGSGTHAAARQMRTELKFVSAVSVADLRRQADDIAKRHRELDTRIQEANWGVDLIEHN